MAKQPNAGPKFRYIDRPEVSEVFADSLGETKIFDGHTAKIEFCVTRWDAPNPPRQPSGRRYPSARLVLTPQAIVELGNFINQLLGLLKQQGLVNVEPVPMGDKTSH